MKNKIIIPIILLLLIVVLVAVFFSLVFFDVIPPLFGSSNEIPGNNDGDNTPVKASLFITDGEERLTDESGKAINIVIFPGESRLFGITNLSELSYTVKIMPNSNASETFDFYTQSGQLRSFYMQGDLTKGFGIVQKTDHFTIAIPELGVEGILGMVYSETVDVVDPIPAADLFAAVIEFENGSILVLEFSIGVYADGITLSENEVVF